eukprot:CAMPEP_0182796758 /NCGR_PEP_ID=MMETSP0006_2-20121128/443_1 /TAXON_ID=97485 /ORGANISM="Prymnesium parvum, Strain Texoma1" /LENGTH=65 /DNA_ID=CAMNT_0024921741 /DNA_START=439 /DNA_END=632 /DNA_ORIENTATION=+
MTGSIITAIEMGQHTSFETELAAPCGLRPACSIAPTAVGASSLCPALGCRAAERTACGDVSAERR